MTDKELLELAAKAAGYVLGQHSQKEWAVTLGGKEWNPLTDDGDALRLAVKRNIGIDFGLYDRAVKVRAGRLLSVPCFEDVENDPYAATRRAIVRAAAEIGKGME